MSKYKAYRVDWVDSTRINSWTFKDLLEHEVKKTNLEVVSVGFIVYQDDKVVVISDSASMECINSPTIIPKVAVTAMQELTGWDKDAIQI